MKVGQFARYEIREQFLDEDLMLRESNIKEVLFGQITQIKKQFVMIDKRLVTLDDIIKFDDKLENLVEKGDAYYYTINGKMLWNPKFLNWDTDIKTFKNTIQNNIKQGGKLHLVARENIPWSEIKR